MQNNLLLLPSRFLIRDHDVPSARNLTTSTAPVQSGVTGRASFPKNSSRVIPFHVRNNDLTLRESSIF